MKKTNSKPLSESFLDYKTQEERNKEAKKEFDEREKEINKEIDKLKDAVDDINEQPKDIEPDFKDGSGKAIKLKAFNEKLYLNEEVLDENIPFDLAKAYKEVKYAKRGGYGSKNFLQNEVPQSDLYNAEYREVTPEEALEISKTKPESLRLLIKDHRGNLKLVTKGEKNKGSILYRIDWLPKEKRYEKRTGETVEDTAKIPFSYLITIADKIYYTNDREVLRDPELLATRKESNPITAYNELNSVENPGGIRTLASGNLAGASYKAGISSWAGLDSIRKSADYWKKRYDEYPNDNYYRRNYLDAVKKYKDTLARSNYAFSELDLKRPIIKYSELKNKILTTEKTLNKAQDKLDTFTPTSAEIQRRINNYKDSIRGYLKEVIDLEMSLEIADEEDQELLNNLNDEINLKNSEISDLNTELRNFINSKKYGDSSTQQVTESFKVISSLESFRPWSGAEDTWRKIEEAGLLDEFESILEELYPDGLSETELNDFLWFEQDYILELLGLSGEEQDEE